MHINSISCGQGAPSLYMVVMAGEGVFPADVVITADTGWENDMLWSTGERTTAKEYFARVTKPLAESYGFGAAFVRAQNGQGREMLPIPDMQRRPAPNGSKHKYLIDIPLHGSEGGRMRQSCTGKWKITAVRQDMRRRGADTATVYLGLTIDEVHRMRPSDVKWCTNTWPLIDARLYRASIITELEKRSIPYLISTECDGCPHKNTARWKRTSQAMIDELAVFETRFKGEFFLTSQRIPLKEAIANMDDGQLSLFDACDSGYCFT